MTATTTSGALGRLFHHRWAVPALATLHDLGGGAKLVTLVNKAGATRDSMRRTLTALIDLNLVRRNPGYGHPMRPEYLLTPKGKRVAPACAALWRTLQALGLEQVAFKKWALPALGTLGRSGERFGRIGEALGPVTPRALAQALRELERAGMIERRLRDGTPPFAEYHVTRSGKKLAAQVTTLEGAALSSVG